MDGTDHTLSGPWGLYLALALLALFIYAIYEASKGRDDDQEEE